MPEGVSEGEEGGARSATAWFEEGSRGREEGVVREEVEDGGSAGVLVTVDVSSAHHP